MGTTSITLGTFVQECYVIMLTDRCLSHAIRYLKCQQLDQLGIMITSAINKEAGGVITSANNKEVVGITTTADNKEPGGIATTTNNEEAGV